MEFKGFTPDTYRFLIELSLNNNKLFFDANKQRYIDNVKTPMTALATELMPVMLGIDPDFNTKMNSIVSRIYRDARRTHGRDPYRDHAWLSFKHPQRDNSEGFCMYFGIEPSSYSYGMGIYAPTPAMLQPMRERIMADPERFLDLVNAPALSRYTIEGELYKKDHFPAEREAIKPYLNRRGLSWCYSSSDIRSSFDAEALFNEIKTAVTGMAALYQFLTFSLDI